MSKTVKSVIKAIPFASITRKLTLKRNKGFKSTADYWEKRYRAKGNSGAGSYGRLAEFKAKIINDFVAENNIQSVVEYGCGDGNQLTLASYPKYIGLDISNAAIKLCRKKFKNDSTKSFYVLGTADNTDAELALSLDVIYHLVEDELFASYMSDLFGSATKFVCIYSLNAPEDSVSLAKHICVREFTKWVDEHAPDFELSLTIPNLYPFDENDPDNTSISDFFFFKRKNV